MQTRSSAKIVQSPSIEGSLDDQKKLALPELGEIVSLKDETWIRSLYHHLTTEPAIDIFLRKSHSYSLAKRRWKLPRSYSKWLNVDLHTPFLKVLSSILAHFWNDPSIRGTRVVIDTHETSQLMLSESCKTKYNCTRACSAIFSTIVLCSLSRNDAPVCSHLHVLRDASH